MGIIVNQKQQLFTLQTKNSTYQFKAGPYGIVQHQYYGKKTEQEDLSYQLQYDDTGFSGNPYDAGSDRSFSLDLLPQEYTSNGVGDYRINSIDVIHENGSRGVDLRLVSYEIRPGKYTLPGLPALYDDSEEAETLCITLKDTASDLEVTLYYGVFEALDIITRAVWIKNTGKRPVTLEKAASLCLDIPHGEYDFIHFHGRHNMERQLQRTSMLNGIQSVGSTRGTSSHQHNPFVILCDKHAAEDYGSCYGIALVYSGGFEAEAEVDQRGQTRLIMGINSKGFTWLLNPSEGFYTPEAVMAYSPNGFTPLSHTLHHAFRHNLCRGEYKLKRRPVLINSWEAAYFAFHDEKLLDIARGAAELGVEMLVMDDGWFGKRDDDTSGLGDWFINTGKLRGGLPPLVSKVNELGLKFGIWFEPEMISEDSDLYRSHPDWALMMPGRKPNRSRFQLVLDMSREDVRSYLYERICSVLDSANIEYVKWDMNRSLCDLYSHQLPPDRQGELSHRYVLGLYELLERLTSRYPHILFEGCSGGGGRFDPGMLYYTPQIWCSDDTDAAERLKIQYGTSFAYPVSAVGSHVSAVPNHQTGRSTPFETRGIVAMAGSFGYELDLNTISDNEKEMVKEQIAGYKKYWRLIHDGLYYRLSDPFRQNRFTAWQYVSPDGSESLVHAVITHAEANSGRLHICLKGLAKDKLYRISGMDGLYRGSALMYAGLLLPRVTEDYQAVEFHLTEAL